MGENASLYDPAKENGSDVFGYNISNSNTLSESAYLVNEIGHKIVLPILYSSISLVGLVGNGSVVFVILSQRKMRTKINMLLLNLAVSDIVFLTFCVPFAIYHFAADTWNIWSGFCKLYHYTFYVSTYVTAYTMVAISVVRYLLVAHSRRAIASLDERVLLTVTVVIWVTFLLANIPILMAYKIKTYQHKDYIPYHYCAAEIPETAGQIELSFFLMSYLLPLSCISFFYLLLVRYLCRQRRFSSLASSSNGFGRAEMSAAASNIVVRVIVVFAVSWLPLHVLLLIIYNLNVRISNLTLLLCRLVADSLAYSNSMVNPIVYNYFSKEFRKSYYRVIRYYLCHKQPRGRKATDPCENHNVEIKLQHHNEVFCSSNEV